MAKMFLGKRKHGKLYRMQHKTLPKQEVSTEEESPPVLPVLVPPRSSDQPYGPGRIDFLKKRPKHASSKSVNVQRPVRYIQPSPKVRSAFGVSEIPTTERSTPVSVATENDELALIDRILEKAERREAEIEKLKAELRSQSSVIERGQHTLQNILKEKKGDEQRIAQLKAEKQRLNAMIQQNDATIAQLEAAIQQLKAKHEETMRQNSSVENLASRVAQYLKE